MICYIKTSLWIKIQVWRYAGLFLLLTICLDRISFIDFEYASYNPRGFDIGNHFNEYAGMISVLILVNTILILYLGFGPDYTLYPDKESQYRFLRHYLEAAQGEFN